MNSKLDANARFNIDKNSPESRLLYAKFFILVDPIPKELHFGVRNELWSTISSDLPCDKVDGFKYSIADLRNFINDKAVQVPPFLNGSRLGQNPLHLSGTIASSSEGVKCCCFYISS